MRYLAVTSINAAENIASAFRAAKDLSALAIDVQLGDDDTPVADAVKLSRRIRDVARDFDLPFAIQTHRETFTETPEAGLALCREYLKTTDEMLPLCLDHSHFVAVRHLAPGTF